MASKIGNSKSGWLDKYIGMMALGAIMQGPAYESFISMVSPAFMGILNLTNDANPKVRVGACWVMYRMAEC